MSSPGDRVERVSQALVDRGLRLALAESCTGGLLAAALTERAGASRFLLAGFVTYSNESKERILGVPSAALAAHGAVSGPVARAMAAGARGVVGAEAAVAITGVAGPDGGTAAKPVGTVWIAAELPGRSEAREFHFQGSRRGIREASVSAALDLLLLMLDGR